jgi:hypothetical protein
VALVGATAQAQSKYPGTTLAPSTVPTAPPPRPAAIPPVATPPPAQAAPAPAENNTAVARLADSLPLDPATRDLRNRLPADPRGIERRLGLREPHGPRVDMRGRTPTPKEIADALAH